jgi:nucleotide-binding universal stress UspA family protein
MNTVRKILVPIDFSEDSANGLNYAVSLAQKTQAELIVLHVTEKKDADSFLDVLAVLEGAPMLNRPSIAARESIDLYHFIEKVVKTPA